MVVTQARMEGMRRNRRDDVAKRQEQEHRRRVESLVERARTERSLPALKRVLVEIARELETEGGDWH